MAASNSTGLSFGCFDPVYLLGRPMHTGSGSGPPSNTETTIAITGGMHCITMVSSKGRLVGWARQPAGEGRSIGTGGFWACLWFGCVHRVLRVGGCSPGLRCPVSAGVSGGGHRSAAAEQAEEGQDPHGVLLS